MKLRILAVTLSALLISSNTLAVEVYNKNGNRLNIGGKVVGQHYFSTDSSELGDEKGDQSYVRLNIRGTTKISETLTGYGRWQYHFSGNNVESTDKGNKTRRAYAGIRHSDLGSFDYGRNYGVGYDVAAFTDVLPEFGNDTWTQTDVFATGRTTGVATYRHSGLYGLVDGLSFALQYQGKEENNDVRKAHKQHGDGWGISSIYEYEGFSLGATYAASDRTNRQVQRGQQTSSGSTKDIYAGGNNAEAWAIATKYDANNIYIAAMYAETRNMTVFGDDNNIANKAQHLEIVAQYQFDFGLRPSIAYLHSKGYDLGRFGDKTLVDYIDVSAIYYFNKNMSTYVDYKINLLDKNNFTTNRVINTDNIIAAGIVYEF